MLSLTEIIQIILQSCGLELHDSERTPAPFQKRVEPKQKKPKQIQQDADNVQRDSLHRPWYVKEEQRDDEVTEIEFQLVTEAEAKSNREVSREELEGLVGTDLKITKYRELKKYWAKGMSAAKTAKIFQDQYGYSIRTLEKYWSQFNKFKNIET